MVNKPASEALVEPLPRSSRVLLTEVKAHPNGHIFDGPDPATRDLSDL